MDGSEHGAMLKLWASHTVKRRFQDDAGDVLGAQPQGGGNEASQKAMLASGCQMQHDGIRMCLPWRDEKKTTLTRLRGEKMGTRGRKGADGKWSNAERMPVDIRTRRREMRARLRTG